jgi:uncharacterized protein YbjQ (UPF0145 family)
MSEDGAMVANPYREGTELVEEIVVTTGNDVAGFRIERYLGVVRGIVVRAPSMGQGFRGAFRQIVGGNIQPYEQVCEAARHEAYTRMLTHARELGAHGIVAMRYDATEFSSGVTEVLAYGTAVTLVQP